jgi:glutaconyl-CoA/methylmalonyl-CoA decarboxylase subunit gamma
VRFRARLNGDERMRAIELLGEAPSFDVELDGRASSYHAVRLAPGRFSIVDAEGRHVDASIASTADGGVRVHVGSAVVDLTLLDELAARTLLAAGKGKARKTGDLRAAIPGRVLRVNVAPGDSVEHGQTLLVLEAMKMENEVRSNLSGRVRAVDVVPGQAVGSGDVLVRFEEG